MGSAFSFFIKNGALEGKIVVISPREKVAISTIVLKYPHMPYHSFDFQLLIFPTMLLQRRLDPLHERQYSLFLQTLPDDLDGHRESLHLIRVVILVRTLGHTIQILEPKRGGQSIQCAVDMSHRKDSAAVVELLFPVLSIRCGTQDKLHQVC